MLSTMRLLLAPIALFLALLLLTGCELFGSEPDTRVVATGTVVFAETGEPIEGLGVVLRATGGYGSAVFIRARTTTAPDGSFELTFEAPEWGAYTFRVNDDPYNDDYATFSDPIRAGESKDYGVIELPRTED